MLIKKQIMINKPDMKIYKFNLKYRNCPVYYLKSTAHQSSKKSLL